MYDSAGVYIKERDLSHIIAQESQTVAALVGVFRKGPTKRPVLLTSTKMLREIFGDPDASISFAGYCGINFFEKGGRALMVQRVVHDDATYGAAIMRENLTLETAEIEDIDDIDWETLSGEDSAVFLAITDVGQGSGSSTKSFELRSNNVLAPEVTAFLVAGGSLSEDVHDYLVVARNGDLRSGHIALSATETPADGNLSVQLDWAWDGVATSYDIYRKVGSGDYQKITTVGLADKSSTDTFSFTDTGSLTADPDDEVALPLAAITEDKFQVLFYDTTVYANTPVERYECTWTDTVSGDGVQMQIEEQINTRSTRFFVSLNPGAEPPIVFNTARTTLGAGNSGTAPTSSDVANGWDAFADKEEFPQVRVFINAGYTNPTVQNKMIQVAVARADAFAILDAPVTAQVQDNPFKYTDYRRLTLNANTNRAAIYGPDILYADTINGKTLYVPPSGYVAGVFAYTDYTRNPSYQPAGLRRGQLPNALGVRVRYKLADRNILGPAQCNPIVNFPGEGIIPWEGLTLQAEQSGFSFISIRRIFDTIEIAIERFLKPEVHDPNDDFTRRSIKNSLEEYLAYWVKQRAIKRAEVIISDDINPGYETTLGKLNVHILIEPIYPVRFIECTIGLTKAGANFEYLISGGALN